MNAEHEAQEGPHSRERGGAVLRRFLRKGHNAVV